MTDTTQTAPLLEASDTELRVTWPDRQVAVCNVLWLRDNCPSGGDKRSAIRSFSVDQLDPDLALDRAAVGPDGAIVIEFSDGHRSAFDPTWLRANSRVGAMRDDAVVRWRRDVELPTLAAAELATDTGHHRLLEALVSHGAAVVTDVPTDVVGTEALAAELGRIRETDFGRLFDIVSEPEVWELSQSTAALDPHTDDPYRYTPSGMSILHCVEASSDGGGRSSLVDGFAVAEDLRHRAPVAFQLLSSVAVPWIRYRAESVDQGEAVHMRADASVIALDRDGEVCGIRFHERSMGVLEIEPELMAAYYRALIEFVHCIRSAEFQWEHGLAPGEALVFDNQRVLHGRTAFTAPASGTSARRHLRLCTVDRDQAHSALRLLRATLGTGTEFASLPAGNLS